MCSVTAGVIHISSNSGLRVSLFSHPDEHLLFIFCFWIVVCNDTVTHIKLCLPAVRTQGLYVFAYRSLHSFGEPMLRVLHKGA